MFELHVVVAVIVMFNILELTVEIVPNYPTVRRWREPNSTKKLKKDNLPTQNKSLVYLYHGTRLFVGI
jgi:hypothetical protein